MKHSGIFTKTILTVVLCIVICFCFSAVAFAQTASDITLAVITDKESYESKEQIEVSLIAKNISAEPLYNVCLKADVPSGFKIEGDQKDYKKISVLNPNETLEFTSVLRQKSVVIETPKTGDSKVTLFITLGVMLLVWVALAIIVKINDRKARGMLSMVLCIALAGGSAFVVADAATSYVKAEKNITVNGKTVTVGGTAEYAKEGNLNTPQVPENDIPKVELSTDDSLQTFAAALGTEVKANAEYKEYIEIDGLFMGTWADEKCEKCGAETIYDFINVIKNDNNKNVTLFGMCIGDSLDKVNQKIKESNNALYFGGKEINGDGEYRGDNYEAPFILNIKDGVLASYELRKGYTSSSCDCEYEQYVAPLMIEFKNGESKVVDLEADGDPETIVFTFTETSNDEIEANLTIKRSDGSSISEKFYGFYFMKVFALKLDPSSGVMTLAYNTEHDPAGYKFGLFDYKNGKLHDLFYANAEFIKISNDNAVTICERVECFGTYFGYCNYKLKDGRMIATKDQETIIPTPSNKDDLEWRILTIKSDLPVTFIENGVEEKGTILKGEQIYITKITENFTKAHFSTSDDMCSGYINFEYVDGYRCYIDGKSEFVYFEDLPYSG